MYIVLTTEIASISGVATEAARRRFARVLAQASKPGAPAKAASGLPDKPGERPCEERAEEGGRDHQHHRRGGRIALAQTTGAARGKQNDCDPARECGETGNSPRPGNGRR